MLMAVKESDAELSNPDAPHALTAAAAHPAKTMTMNATIRKVAKEARAKVARAKVAREATSALRSCSSQQTAPAFLDGLRSTSQLKARPTSANLKSQLSLKALPAARVPADSTSTRPESSQTIVATL